MEYLRFSLGSHTYQFKDLKDLFAKATPLRSGDELAGIAAASFEERVAAQMCLADLPLKSIAENPLIPYEQDEVTRVIWDSWDQEAFQPVSSLTVGEFRDFLLEPSTDGVCLKQLAPGLLPEMAAAVSKIMRNQDLILVAQKIEVVTQFRSTVGKKGHLSIRLQPNHPVDDLRAIAASTLDGLLLGCGDAVIGVNPATDSIHKLSEIHQLLSEMIEAFSIPTQACVLGHVTHQLEAMEKGVPIDLVFQSIGGSELTHQNFGISFSLIKEAQSAALSQKRGSETIMYFETGQGSALSANAHWGVDQQTLEVRAYGFARVFKPFLVNSVVGFIGPEYLFDGKQITRAGLEDHFCGKLLGLPMGCDVCYTNHAEADQDDMDVLLTLLALAGCNYFMGVPGADDIMLNYQSTSFHDARYLRSVLQLRPSPEFEVWLQKWGIEDQKGMLLDPLKSKNLLKSFSRFLPKGPTT